MHPYHMGCVYKNVRYIPLIGQNHSLSLKSLSMKLVKLLAFTKLSKSYDLFNHGLMYMITLQMVWRVQTHTVLLNNPDHLGQPLYLCFQQESFP